MRLSFPAAHLAGALLSLVPLRLVATQPAPPIRAFVGATVWEGTRAVPIVDATIVVQGERVLSVSPTAKARIPAGAEVVNLRGKFIVPGLINAHGHASSVANLATYAVYGVTTVYSLGDETPDVFAARAAQRTTSPSHARVFVAGPVLAPTSSDDARTQVEAVVAKDVDIVKIRVDDNLGAAKKMTPDVYRAVIREAHARGKRVAVHVYYLDDAQALLDAGADYIAHSVRDRAVDSRFVQSIKTRGVCYSPTLMREVSTYVYDTIPAFFGDSQFLAHANRQWMATVAEPARMAATRASSSARTYKTQLPLAMKNLATLHAAGVPIAMGTDTGPLGRFQGFFELMEMEMMVDAGMSPQAVLSSATLGAARCLHIEREVGSLEKGKWADFVVLDASPLENIRNIRRQHSVWVGGNRVDTTPVGAGR